MAEPPDTWLDRLIVAFVIFALLVLLSFGVRACFIDPTAPSECKDLPVNQQDICLQLERDR